MKLSRKIKVTNLLGLHARPATTIVKILQGFKSSVYFSMKKEKVNARSIINILMLAAKQGSEIMIDVEGDDAQEAMDRLVEAFEQRFWE